MTTILTLFLLWLEYIVLIDARIESMNQYHEEKKGLGDESKDWKTFDSKRNIVEVQRLAKLWASICLSET